MLCQCNVLGANGIKTVTILADDGYPPYSYIENNKLKGIYVDIVRAAAKLLAPYYRVNIIATPWKRALLNMKNGSAFGILPPYKRIEERNYIWPYSLAIMSETVVAYCQKDINIIDYFDALIDTELAPLNIGVNAGYMIFSDEIKVAIKNKKMIVWENKNTGANILKLQSKRIDCYINDRLSIQHELLRLKKLRQLNIDGISESLHVMSQTAHIGYSDSANDRYTFKSDFVHRMDAALSKIKSSEQYSQIIESYANP